MSRAIRLFAATFLFVSDPGFAQMPGASPGSIDRARENIVDASGWVELAPALVPRYEAQSAVVNGRLYVFAGFMEHAWPVIYITETTEMYDPQTGQWSLRAPMPEPVTHTTAAVVGDSVWIVGGFVGDHPGTATDAVQIYDTANDVWTSGPPLPAARASAALVRLGRRLHFFGGLLSDRDTDVGDHFVLDLERTSAGWSTAAPLPEPRNHHGGAAFAGRLYAVGGQHGHDVQRTLVSYVHAYDPVTDTWTGRADLPIARSHFEPGTLVVDSRILIAGGVAQDAHHRPESDLLTAYDPFADTWINLEPLPEKLLAPVAKPIGSQLLVSHGGREGGVFPEDRAWGREIIRTGRDTLGFWPERLSITVGAGEEAEAEVLLWSTAADATYRIEMLEAPAWIGEVAPATGRATAGGETVRVAVDASGLEAGTYAGRVKAGASGASEAYLDVSLTVVANPVSVDSEEVFPSLTVQPAFPNPFESETVLRFQTTRSESVRATLYSALGQEVGVLYEATPRPNVPQSIRISALDLPSGLYLVRIKTATSRFSAPLILAR